MASFRDNDTSEIKSFTNEILQASQNAVNTVHN